MARKIALGTADATHIKLTAETLDLLKQVSQSAVACAVFGAAINRDVESLQAVVKYLGTSKDQGSGAMSLDGKSLLGRDHHVAAYTRQDDGKVVEVKDKAYIFPLLLKPLMHLSREQYQANSAARSYVEDVIALVDRLKIASRPVGEAINVLLQMPANGPFEEVASQLIQKIKKATDLMPLVTDQSWNVRRGTERETMRQRSQFLFRMALETPEIAKALRSQLQKGEITADRPDLFPLLTLSGDKWPVNEDSRDLLRDLVAIRAIQALEKGGNQFLHTGYPQAKADDKVLPHPIEPSLEPVDSREYIRLYGQIPEPVPAFVAAVVGRPFNYRAKSEHQQIWNDVAPIQKRADEHGGPQPWLSLFQRVYADTKLLSDLIRDHGQGNVQGLSDALSSLSWQYLAYKEEIENPEILTQLLAAGANPSHRSRGHRSFEEALQTTPKIRDLKDYPELAKALQARKAALAIDASMAESKKSVDPSIS